MGLIGLLKFGERAHIERLVAQGELFFNTIEYFQGKHHDGTTHRRFDKFEGHSHIFQSSFVKKFEINGREYKLHPDGGPMLVNLNNAEYYTHVCCFTKVQEPLVMEGTPRVFDPRMFEFGAAFAFVLDVKSFMERVFNYVKASKDIAELKAGEVIYFDSKEYSGEMGAFRKADTYSYQREYRIALNSTTEGPYTMKLGSFEGTAFGPIDKDKSINLVRDGQALIS